MNTKMIIAIAVGGCLLMILGCALAGFDFGALFADKAVYTEVRHAETIGAEDTVQVRVDSETVKLGLSGDGQAHIVYWDSHKEKHLYAYENGVLSLTMDSASRKWYDYISFTFAPAQRVVEVLLPSDFHGAVEVRSTTGAIRADALGALSRLSLALTTGDVTVSGCEAADARFVTASGKVKLTQLRGGTFYAECTTGQVNVDGLTAAALTVRSVSGDAVLAGAACDSIDISGATGAVRLEQAAAKDISLSVTTGDITGTIACDPTEFTIDASTVTGANNLGSVHFGGQRRLNVKTTTGNIHITFAE